MAVIINGKVVTDPPGPGGTNQAREFEVIMDTITSPLPGVDSVTVGLRVVDEDGAPLKSPVELQLSAFDDGAGAIPALSATLGSAAEGSILAGLGTASVRVRTNSTGRFECVLSNAIDETNYLACDSVDGGPDLDCRSTASVTFS